MYLGLSVFSLVDAAGVGVVAWVTVEMVGVFGVVVCSGSGVGSGAGVRVDCAGESLLGSGRLSQYAGLTVASEGCGVGVGWGCWAGSVGAIGAAGCLVCGCAVGCGW